MGSGDSKEKKSEEHKPKPKRMPYKRQFSAHDSRSKQHSQYSEYRQATISENRVQNEQIRKAASDEYEEEAKTATKIDTNAPGLDPKKYIPPPSPAIGDSTVESLQPPSKAHSTANVSESIEEEHEDEEEIDAQRLQIEDNQSRRLSPGTALIHESLDPNVKGSDGVEAKPKKSTILKEAPSPDVLIKQTSDHERLQSPKSVHSNSSESTESKINSVSNFEALKWGYCELTRKQQDEDQAAFLTWTHPEDGFVHSWAIFDGHGGYETALYSAQHFLKYVEKHHLTKTEMTMGQWPALMQDIFLQFDRHIGTQHIPGGSTVVCVLLIGDHIICANAGDARAIMSERDGKAVDLSFDHSPMNDYDRLVEVAKSKDHWKRIHKFFRINAKDETYEDIKKLPPSEAKKAPFISREQDKSRLLGTIGVARGFGDYSLTVFGVRSLKLKPYLSAKPFVVVKRLEEEAIGDTDLMCIACDGVFDVMSNQEVLDVLRKEIFYRIRNDDDPEKKAEKGKDSKKVVYSKEPITEVDADRIDRACGFLGLRSYVKGTMDDVTIFVVPLKEALAFSKLTGCQ